MNWHTDKERKLIKKFGGTPLIKYGFDGKINGKPVEVRCCRKDKRFRIQKNVHEVLLKKRGYYIFDAPGHRPVRMTAYKVDKLLSGKKWFKDRTYPHKFIRIHQVWE